LSVSGIVIKVETAEVMLVDAHYHQLLDVSILVLGQGRIEIERRDLVFLEPGID